MRTFRRTYKISETFPVEEDEEWIVTERGIAAEHWRVVHKTRGSFTAEITEYFEKGGVPRGAH